MTWSADAADRSGAGLAGYSVVWDTSPDTIPDRAVDLGIATSATTSPALPDGANHYFHLRTCDNVGVCSEPAHLGPFVIQTAPVSDTYEPNDDCAQAHAIAPGAVYTSYLMSASDVDYFKIYVGQPYTTLKLRLNHPTRDYDLAPTTAAR